MVGNVTEILSEVGLDSSHSSARLLPLVYCELRQLALSHLRYENSGHTLQATALVHEAFLRLVHQETGPNAVVWRNRSHFFAAAAEAMRRILVENARRKRRIKRGGDKVRLRIDISSIASNSQPN